MSNYLKTSLREECGGDGGSKNTKLHYGVVGKTAEITDSSKLVNIYLLSILTKGTNILINLSKVVI